MEPSAAADPQPTVATDVELTVLIPAYRAAASIERAIDSVLRDAPDGVECLVVDDGSDDGTAEVVQRAARRDPRIRLVALPTNVGVSEARNRGLEAVRGTWLTFLDADDRLLPGALRALRGPARHPEVRIVVGQRVWTDGERTWISRLYDIPDIRQPGRRSLVTHPGLLYYASATGKLFHRSVIEGLRFEGRVLGDQPWTIRAMLRAGDGIEVITADVYEWTRPRPDAPSSSITALTRRSAARSAMSAQVARGAYRTVVAEAAAAPDPARRVIASAYFERLVRSDFASALSRALERRDEGLDGFLDALADLLAEVPPDVRDTGGLAYRHLVRPCWERWAALDGPARRAFWRLYREARRLDPGLPPRLAGSRFLVPGLVASRLVTAVLPGWSGGVVGPVRSLGDRIRRLRRR